MGTGQAWCLSSLLALVCCPPLWPSLHMNILQTKSRTKLVHEMNVIKVQVNESLKMLLLWQ